MQQQRYAGAVALLTSPFFLIAVGLLVLNDWVLKPAFGNWATGKLSDFAGLAAFAMFWAALLPRHRRAAFFATGAAFVLWKSPLIDPALEAWNAMAAWPLARVLDYSDLVALAVLPPTYRAVQRVIEQRSTRPGSFTRRLGAVSAGITSILAFSATSVYRPTPIDGMEYGVPGSRTDVLAGLDSLRIPVSGRPKHRPSSSADTLVVHIRHPPERWLSITVEVYEAFPGESQIRPIALGAHGPPPSDESLRRAFSAKVIEPLREWLAVHGGQGSPARPVPDP